jgi:hypothetical protein
MTPAVAQSTTLGRGGHVWDGFARGLIGQEAIVSFSIWLA